MSDSDILLKCENVSKRFCRSLKRSLYYAAKDIAKEVVPISRGQKSRQLRNGEFWALDDVSFDLKRGECLGIIGHNGAGKTTLLKVLNGLLKPDQGRVEMRGRVGALIALGAGFNPILTGRENIYANGSILGLTRREIDAKADEIIDFAELASAIDSPVRNYSSGMQARLGFAVAAHMDPDILLIDEVLAVGDVSFRNRCLRFIEGIREKGGCYILVTHSFNQVLTSCPTALLMHRGSPLAFGNSAEVVERAIEVQFEDGRTDQGESESSNSPANKDSQLRIINGRLQAVGGGPAVSNQPIEIVLEIDSTCELKDCTWAFYLWNKENILRLISKHSIDVKSSVSIPAGRSVLSVIAGPLALCPRKYSFRATVSDSSGQLLDALGYDDKPYWVSVESRQSDLEEVRSSVIEDLVALEVNWSDVKISRR